MKLRTHPIQHTQGGRETEHVCSSSCPRQRRPDESQQHYCGSCFHEGSCNVYLGPRTLICLDRAELAEAPDAASCWSWAAAGGCSGDD